MARPTAQQLIRTEIFKLLLRGNSNSLGLPELRFFELPALVSSETARLILNDAATQTPRNLCVCGLVAAIVDCPHTDVVVDQFGNKTVLPPVPTDVLIALLDALIEELPTSFQKSIPLLRKRSLLEGADDYRTMLLNGSCRPESSPDTGDSGVRADE